MIDVRPEPEYAAGHIAGARSIPIDELAANIKDLPAEVEIVAYCRGPYCVFADDAVRLLRRRGRPARRLEDGFPEWQRANLPVTGRGSVVAVPTSPRPRGGPSWWRGCAGFAVAASR